MVIDMKFSLKKAFTGKGPFDEVKPSKLRLMVGVPKHRKKIKIPGIN